MVNFIRASRLPLALTCPASAEAQANAVATDGEPARLGSAAHEWLAHQIQNKGQQNTPFSNYAEKWRVDGEELAPLCWQAKRLWDGVKKWFPTCRTEYTLSEVMDEGLTVQGTIDVFFFDEENGRCIIADHKTGYLDSDHTDQLKAYAWLAMKVYQVPEVHTITLRARHGVADHATYSSEDLWAWSVGVIDRLTYQASTFNPGGHCGHCPRWANCPEFKMMASSSLAILGQEVTPQGVLKAYEKLQVVKKLTRVADDAIRALVVAQGGEIRLTPDVVLKLTQQERQEIKYSPATFEAAMDYLPTGGMFPCLKVSKTALEKAVKENAPRGSKQTQWDALMARLEELGQIDTKTIERLELKRNSQVLESEAA